MDAGNFEQITELPLEAIDERLQRYRLQVPRAEQAMARSLERYGQISPIVVCRQEEAHVLIDGFKRVQAARKLKGMSRVQACLLPVDEQVRQSRPLQPEPYRATAAALGGGLDRACLGP